MKNAGTSILEVMESYIKQIIEQMLMQERRIFLEEHPETKGNGFYERDLVTALGTLNKVRAQDRAAVAEALKQIYRSPELGHAQAALQNFRLKWGKLYPQLVKQWEELFPEITTFLQLPSEIRCYVYTTNALERFIKEVKRRLKTMEMLPGEKSAEKFLYLLLKEINTKYSRRKLSNWEYYFQKYLERKKSNPVHRKLQTQLT